LTPNDRILDRSEARTKITSRRMNPFREINWARDPASV
jgi:hypothetical protein